MSDRPRCPHCQKPVADENALFQHVQARHGSKAAKVFRQPRESDSVADELVEALQSGERPPEYLAVMFPEAFRL